MRGRGHVVAAVAAVVGHVHVHHVHALVVHAVVHFFFATPGRLVFTEAQGKQRAYEALELTVARRVKIDGPQSMVVLFVFAPSVFEWV